MGGRIIPRIAVLLCVLLLPLGAAAAPALTDAFCHDCHDHKALTKTGAGGKEISVFVDKARLAGSVHATNTCVSCHADVTAKHPDDNKPVQQVSCARCHEK